MTTHRYPALVLGVLGGLLGSAVTAGSVRADQADAVAGRFEVKYEEVTSNCTNTGMSMLRGVFEIEKKKATTAEAGEEKKSDKKPPDLSGVGLERKPEWIAAYLMKTESIKGEKHGRKFRGPEADLKLVSAWLSSLKTKKK